MFPPKMTELLYHKHVFSTIRRIKSEIVAFEFDLTLIKQTFMIVSNNYIHGVEGNE